VAWCGDAEDRVERRRCAPLSQGGAHRSPARSFARRCVPHCSSYMPTTTERRISRFSNRVRVVPPLPRRHSTFTRSGTSQMQTSPRLRDARAATSTQTCVAGAALATHLSMALHVVPARLARDASAILVPTDSAVGVRLAAAAAAT
jgi:hypothetical protein